jgi:CheY-like chemotaxis protein
MSINQCPACWRANADEALSCAACGAPLGAVDTVRLPLESTVRPASVGALWLDDLVAPTVGPRPDTDPGPAEINLTLRDIDPTPPTEPGPADTLVPASALVQSDGAPPWPVLDPPEAPAPQLTPDATQRAERRAAVRRDRRIGAPAALHAASDAPEVLVVGSPHVPSDPLCSLLRAFGFTVQTAADGAEALSRAASRSLLASFVRAEMSDGNGGNGIDLCGRLRQAHAQASERELLLVLVAAKLRPMDRVRAELAGCDEAIRTPITRGSVARLLDARGIRLPVDPRQA